MTRHCPRRRTAGESLLEVLIALAIVSLLAIESARVHLSQWRVRQVSAQHRIAAGLLDTFAETHRMHSGFDTEVVGRPGAHLPERSGRVPVNGVVVPFVIPTAWRTRAAAALPHARLDVRPIGQGILELGLQWDAERREATARQTVWIVTPTLPTLPTLPPMSFTSGTSFASSASDTLPGMSGRGRIGSRGHTLIELMIASALAGMVMAVSFSAVEVGRRHDERLLDEAAMRFEAQAALDLLRAHIRLAGYGWTFVPPNRTGTSSALSFAGVRGAHNVHHVGRPFVHPVNAVPLRGCDGRATAAPAPGCASASPTRDDTIQVRYLADRVSAWRGTREDRPADCEGRLLAGAEGGIVDAHFSIRTDRVTGRRRLHCSRSGAMAGEPAVEAVDGLQVRFWTATPGTEPVSRRAADLRERDWRQVRGISVCVVIRARQARGGGAFVDCDGRTRTASADGFRRRAYWTTVAVRNALHHTADSRMPDDVTQRSTAHWSDESESADATGAGPAQ
jgi:type IV pilus assembly protein PilW